MVYQSTVLMDYKVQYTEVTLNVPYLLRCTVSGLIIDSLFTQHHHPKFYSVVFILKHLLLMIKDYYL